MDAEVLLTEIRKLCLEFDKKNGDYPEHKYEGRSFYDFAIKFLKPGTYMSSEELDQYNKDLGI